MDIFSTVVSAIDLAEKIVGYAKAVKGGKEDRLSYYPKSPPSSPSFKSCLDALKSTAKSSSFGGIIRDLKWPFRQEDVNTTLGSIERLKSLIMLALQTSLM
ncbi:hypothetical protein BD779DRAFT_1474778 [Infundibulicybe gibba]|nr:hypothetical protein BD779DRAFT_1474778 [Infundibulicybe gibba]